jgi:hypothetical protein
MNKILLNAWNNKHTSAAAIAYGAAKVGSALGAVWFPAHAAQFAQTADIIESAAVGYGLVMAGDAKPTATPPQPNP